MDKYKVNEEISEAVMCAAVKAGSFMQLSKDIGEEEITCAFLQLIADGQFEELSKTTLFALMPKIQEFIQPNERKNIVRYLTAFPKGGRASKSIPFSNDYEPEKGQHNG